MITVERVNKSYGNNQVLNEVSFSLAPGETMVLLGPNGAGKTSLLNMLAVVSQPDSGSIIINGVDAVKHPDQVRPGIGYVPQDIALFEELSVKDNLFFWLRSSDGQARESVNEVVEVFGLSSFYKKEVGNLSGGMKRRVNIAVAMLNRPSFLVMDEPMVGVDIEQSSYITERLKKLAQAGTTMIISSHYAAQLLPLADRFLILRQGSSVFTGTLPELMQYSPDGVDLDKAVLGILNS